MRGKRVNCLGDGMAAMPAVCLWRGNGTPCGFRRVQHKRGGEIPLHALDHLRGTGQVDDLLLKRVLYGIFCRNYERAAAAVPGAIGLSSSTVSRTFTRASAQQLQPLQDRDLRELDVVAVFLDGKTFADMTMVIAVGITLTGEKHILGLVETGKKTRPCSRPFCRAWVTGALTGRRVCW